jgi:hypothetical protein
MDSKFGNRRNLNSTRENKFSLRNCGIFPQQIKLMRDEQFLIEDNFTVRQMLVIFSTSLNNIYHQYENGLVIYLIKDA